MLWKQKLKLFSSRLTQVVVHKQCLQTFFQQERAQKILLWSSTELFCRTHPCLKRAWLRAAPWFFTNASPWKRWSVNRNRISVNSVSTSNSNLLSLLFKFALPDVENAHSFYFKMRTLALYYCKLHFIF